MSFQLENSHPHPTPKSLNLFGATTSVSHDDVLVVSSGIPVTLDLFDIKQSPPRLNFHPPCPVFTPDAFFVFKPRQKRNLEYHTTEKTMSRRNGNNNNNNNNNVPKLDLKLNLSPPSSMMRTNPNLNVRTESPSRSPSVSPPSSCVSSEMSLSSPEATSMVLVGCPRCLMYVMLSEDDPKCPKCKSTVLLDFGHDNNNNNNNDDNNCNNSGCSKKTRKG